MKRVLLAVLVLFAVLCVCYLVSIQREKVALAHHRAYIEAQYAEEIALIEQRSRELPDPDSESIENWELTESIQEELKIALTKPEIFSAGWSLDGHHGARGLKPMDTNGYRTNINSVRAGDDDHTHVLYSGVTFDGVPLLVYCGWVNDGVNRSYTIAFYREAIEQTAAP